jgi:hypothetical protein
VKILESPRWRRRLIKIAVVLAIFPLTYLGIHYSNGGNPENANGPQVANYVQPKRSPFTEAEQRAVHPVLAQFIRYAVAREDPAKAWDLAGPDLRSGLTRKEWDTGAIPVVNYPASHKGLGSWSYVKYSYTNTVGLEVFVFPKPGSGYSAMTADAEVRKDSDGRWQVNYWMPERFHGPASLSAKAKPAKPPTKVALGASKKKSGSHKSAASPSSAPNPNQPRISGIWLLLPVAILSLIIIAPLTLLVIGVIRNRRAAARESLGT